MHGLPEGGLVLAAVHQNSLCTEHFRHFGKHRGTPLSDNPVGEYAEKRIRRDAAESVGAAAFQAHAQLAHRNILTDILRSYGENLPKLLQSVFDLVLNLLGDKHLYTVLIHRAHQLPESVQLVVFAAEAHHQDAAGVGMADHVGKNGAGILMVVAELGAAVVVRERHNGVDTPLLPGDFGLETIYNLLADTIDAAHGGNHPNLVSDANLPVGAAETLESALLRRLRNLHQSRAVAVFQQALEVGLDAAVVHHRARRGILGDMADGETVLNNIIPSLKPVQYNLVPPRDVGDQRHTLHHRTFREVLQGNGDVVGGVDLDVIHTMRFHGQAVE